FRCRALHLHMHPRRNRAVLRRLPDFSERHQIHRLIYHSFLKARVSIYPAVAQKWPVGAMLVNAVPFHVGSHNFFSSYRALGDDLAIGAANKTLPPKFDAVTARRSFVTDAVCGCHKTTIRDCVAALNGFPGRILSRAEFLLF